MDNAILQELYDYYKEDPSLSQSELIISMLTRIQEAVGYVSKDVQEEVARLAGVNRGYVAAIIKNCPICMRRHSAMRSVSASPTDARPEEDSRSF